MGEEIEHPSSWRLFRAHPALGLEETDDAWISAPKPDELDVAWLALPRPEQRAREADLVAAIERAATDPDSRFELQLAPEMTQDGAHGLWMDRWKAPALERELVDCVSTAARSRAAVALPESRRAELDRTLRAHLLVVWDRHAWKAFVAAMALAGLLGLHPWGDRSVGAVVVRVAAAVVVLIALGSLVERWYQRSQREPE